MWLLPLFLDLAGGQTVTQCTGGRSVPSWQGRSPCFRDAAASQGHPLTSLTWDGGLWMQICAGVSWSTHSLCPASHSPRLSGSYRRLRTGCPGLKRKSTKLLLKCNNSENTTTNITQEQLGNHNSKQEKATAKIKTHQQNHQHVTKTISGYKTKDNNKQQMKHKYKYKTQQQHTNTTTNWKFN